MTRPGIEPWSPGSSANTQLIRPMAWCKQDNDPESLLNNVKITQEQKKKKKQKKRKKKRKEKKKEQKIRNYHLATAISWSFSNLITMGWIWLDSPKRIPKEWEWAFLAFDKCLRRSAIYFFSKTFENNPKNL